MNKILTIAALLIFAVGCSTNTSQDVEPADVYTVISEAEISTGDNVPAPIEDVVLIISGAISNTNVDETLQFDMDTLELLGVIEYSVDDQQAEGEVVTFQGVLLSDVLEIAGITEDATNLQTIALNDYSIDIPVSDAYDYPVMIATSVNGERMSVERYGPTRVVYPYESYDLDPVTFDPRWIWQLSEIVVE